MRRLGVLDALFQQNKFRTGSLLARPRQDHRARNARRNAMFTGEEQLAFKQSRIRPYSLLI